MIKNYLYLIILLYKLQLILFIHTYSPFYDVNIQFKKKVEVEFKIQVTSLDLSTKHVCLF